MDNNQLNLNVKKTQLLLWGGKVGQGAGVHQDDIEQLPRSHVVKCLGVWIDDRWKRHIEAVRKKCFWGLAKLRRLQGVLPPVTKRNMYNALAEVSTS